MHHAGPNGDGRDYSRTSLGRELNSASHIDPRECEVSLVSIDRTVSANVPIMSGLQLPCIAIWLANYDSYRPFGAIPSVTGQPRLAI